MTTTVTPAWTCGGCQATRTKPEKRLPRGWKRQAESYYCDTCWSKRYILRAITMPIASPVDTDWKDLREALDQRWRDTTQASNWMITELYARDVRRNGEDKMPPMPRIYLYPEARERFPALPSQSVSALEQQVALKYRSMRYQIIWTCQSSLPTFRYPAPFSVPNQAWTASLDEGNRPIISVRIGEKRVALRLKGGPQFRRQRQSFDQIESGAAVQGELALYRSGTAILCKMVAWLPRVEPGARASTGELRVRTAHDSLLVAVNAKDEALWRYNADHIVRWAAEHRDQLQRWSEDAKYEQRPVPSFAARRTAAVEKQHRRMYSAIQQIAASLVGYAARRKFAQVHYDDAEQGFCEQFPWFLLRQQIATKCDEIGIEFEHASGEATQSPLEPLADVE